MDEQHSEGKQAIERERDGVDSGWFIAAGIGSVRNSASDRPGGWWFLPDWLVDSRESDVGPFRTKALACEEAEVLFVEWQADRSAGLAVTHD